MFDLLAFISSSQVHFVILSFIIFDFIIFTLNVYFIFVYLQPYFCS